MKFRKIEKLIYKQFDSLLSRNEENYLDDALSKSSQLRKEVNDISRIRKLVSSNTTTSFNPFFELKVMNKILYENVNYIDSEILFEALIYQFKKLTFSVFLLVTFLISTNLISGEKINMNTALEIPEVRVEDIFIPTINFLE